MSKVLDLVISKALQILEDVALCDRCLGRQFAWLSTNTTNSDRGYAIKLVLSMVADSWLKAGNEEEGKRIIAILASKGLFVPARELAKRNKIEYTEIQNCRLCVLEDKSIFSKISEIVERAAAKVKEYEFRSFLAGCKPPPQLVDTEDELRAKHQIVHGETFRSDFNREFGKNLRTRIGKVPEFKQPEMVIVYNMVDDEIELQVSPIFIFGKYRKLQRGIPQSRWDCKMCGGKGCDECNGTGRKYPDSIAEYIGEPILEIVGGTKYKFHAAGREDIDALMLGDGRPFVIEIAQPKIRRPDFELITRTINEKAKGKVEVSDLMLASRKVSQSLKKEAAENVKEYKALIQIGKPVSDEKLKKVEKAFEDITISQRTPTRVAHRRADKIREKRVYKVELKLREDGLIDGFFRVQGGTYIKELISGDCGRTQPSISEMLGTEARCIQLNVVNIYDIDSHHNA